MCGKEGAQGQLFIFNNAAMRQGSHISILDILILFYLWAYKIDKQTFHMHELQLSIRKLETIL
uniref:Uncharacterized protein n=1 Tax=Romanomermis culicivorax TaxID=13658 RepID=A0A915J913_ROMCU